MLSISTRSGRSDVADRAYFGELQASIEQILTSPFAGNRCLFCAFREKVEQLRNTLIQSSEDHKRDQQAQERLTERLQALNERVPELITDSKALREELGTAVTSPFIQQIADNRVCQVLTCLPEKFVVDFANGIDVAQEHIRTTGERTFFRRLKRG